MYKKILILLCALMTLLDPQAIQAAPAPAAVAAPAAVETATAVPRPNYKPYRGNSRHRAKKLGVFRRWALRRKALRKRKRKVQHNIRVEKPTRNR